MRLYPVFLGVLTHAAFHILYPRSLFIPSMLSLVFASFAFILHTGPTTTRDILLSFSLYVTSCALSIIAYRLSPFHPLAKYPGPTLAKITKLWGAYNAWSGRQHLVFLSLHREYGPFIRTGPNEISVSDVRATKEVLGTGGLPKGEYYKGWRDFYNHGNLISSVGSEHVRRRRLWTRGMSTESLKEYQPIISEQAQKLGDQLAAGCKHGEVDMARWLGLFAFDVMALISFGKSLRMLDDASNDNGSWKTIEDFAMITSTISHLPWGTYVLQRTPFIHGIMMRMVNLARGLAVRRMTEGAKTHDIWYHLSDERELEGAPLPPQSVASEAGLAVIAGSDTTSGGLASFFYWILLNPEAYSRLQREIDTVYPAGSDATDASQHHRLEWLNACINETLRIAPPVPTNGPRQVPHDSKGAIIAGRFIPPGTQVYVAPYVLHRNPKYFSPSPDSFTPERWLLQDGSTGRSNVEDARLDRNAFIPFSFGPANCVGRPVARLEMLIVVSVIMQRFDIAFAQGFDVKAWPLTVHDHFVTNRGNLMLKLTERYPKS